MSELERYRVTGGVFLIALAVIVLPMLFDGQGIEPEPLPVVGVDIPELPPLPPPELDEDRFAKANELRESVDEEGFLRETDTRVGHVVMDPVRNAPGTDETDTAWGIQLASFSERENAVALRNRLRDDGYSALLSEVKRLTGVSTRVAIGPILTRSEADALQEELSAKYGVDAIVVRMSS